MKKNILIILPFGNLNKEEDRPAQLVQVLNNLKAHIAQVADKSICFFIVIAEQVLPPKYFNRGLLINIAALYFKTCIGMPTHIIFHDIDMLPDKTLFNQYLITRPSYSLLPLHSPTFKKLYGFKLFAGSAIYMTTLENFFKVNGFPNNFWGWGGEDNALDMRYKKQGIILKYNPSGNFISTDKQRTSQTEKIDFLKKNKIRNNLVWELTAEDKKTWQKNGIAQISGKYKLVEDRIENATTNITIIHLKAELFKFE